MCLGYSPSNQIPVKEEEDEIWENINTDKHNETFNFAEIELSESKVLKK